MASNEPWRPLKVSGRWHRDGRRALERRAGPFPGAGGRERLGGDWALSESTLLFAVQARGHQGKACPVFPTLQRDPTSGCKRNWVEGTWGRA